MTGECPNCGAETPSDPRFVTWCQECEWNVDPSPEKALTRREQRAAQASAKASRRLYEQLSATGTHENRALTAVVVAVSLLAHLLTAVTFVIGVLLLVDGFGFVWPVRVVVGGYAVAAALYVQPFRPSAFDRKRKGSPPPLNRSDAPQLFELIDEVAAALGTQGVEGVRLSSDFNASIVHRRDRGWVMTLGLALWSVLGPQEKVAIIGHELGHQINRDQRRNILVYGAASSLQRWSYLLNPRTQVTRTRGMTVAGELFSIVVLLPLAIAAFSLNRLLTILADRQGLSAEYYADLLGSTAGGTDAAVTMLEKLLIADACRRHILQTVKFNRSADPWEEVTAFAAEIPAHEMERRRRLGRLRLPRIDSTHPPSQLRADLIRNRPELPAMVTLADERSAALDEELSTAVASVTAALRASFPA